MAEAEGGDVLLTEKVWTVSQLPGEREPLFTPRPQREPASSACLAGVGGARRGGRRCRLAVLRRLPAAAAGRPSAEVDAAAERRRPGDGNG